MAMTEKPASRGVAACKGAEPPVSVDCTQMVQHMVENGLTEVPAEFVLPPELQPSLTQMKVINHGIPAELMQGAMQMCREFFALPMEEKELYCMKTSSGIGYGCRMAVKEGVRVKWVDRIGFWSASEEHRRRQPLDVKRPEAFNSTTNQYGDEIMKLAHVILAALSQHAGLPGNYLLERVEESNSAGVRTGMNYYPPCPQPEMVIGIGQHADGSVLTMVQQDGTSGLEVLKGSQWVSIPALPEALVVNVGDQIQMISNERYKSVVQRLVAGSGRKSIPNFFLPNWETVISPAPRFCSSSDPPRYRPVKFSKYITEFMKVPLGKERFVDNFKISSHKQKHHQPI